MSAPQLHHDALDRLGHQIVDGVRPVGSVLKLAEIEQDFVVSRTVAREAMRVLESLGLVRSKRRVGITVRPRSQWRVLDPRVVGWRLASQERDQVLLEMIELREAVQPVAAALAAKHATAAERHELLELAASIGRLLRRAADGLDELVALDVRFHTVMLLASRNELFAAVARIVAAVHRQRGGRYLLPPPSQQEVPPMVERLASAIADGDQAGARALSVEQVAPILRRIAADAPAHRPRLADRDRLTAGQSAEVGQRPAR